MYGPRCFTEKTMCAFKISTFTKIYTDWYTLTIFIGVCNRHYCQKRQFEKANQLGRAALQAWNR